MKTLKQRHEDAPQKCGILSVPEAREGLRKALRIMAPDADPGFPTYSYGRAVWSASYYRNNDEFLDIPDDVKYH